MTDFDLYVKPAPDDPPILYRSRNLPFTEEVRQRLIAGGTKYLYISSTDQRSYWQYIERNLTATLSDPDIDITVKSTILYGSAQNLMREIMQDPSAREAIQSSQNLVETTVNYMFAEEKAFQHLLKVTSVDYYTYTHSVDVFVYSVALAQRLGIHDLRALREIGEGTLLHDVGKSALDPAILNCTGELSDEQWRQMKMHPIHGCEILLRSGGLTEGALDMVRHHHEKLRGGSYPDGLKADQIRPWVRICTICDIFDALTTRRAYKQAVTSFVALDLMNREMAKDLDSDYLRVFIEMMGNSTR